MKKLLILITILLLVFLYGCSSSGKSPVVPAGQSDYPFVADNSIPPGTELFGAYTATFDLSNLNAEITPDRDIAAHFNITSYLPAPTIHINSYNPSTNIVDADITINNITAIVSYDLRLIIYTDNIGHKLLNDDNWTGLFDIAGGLPINPFKAYMKSDPNREFPGKFQSTENVQVYLPGANPNVRFAIEASYPSNCAEPYKMNNFTQGVLYDQVGSSTQVGVDVYDWQNNVSSVKLYCPQITGVSLVDLSNMIGNHWQMQLSNNTGASAGNYATYLVATSSGQNLYDEIKLVVTHQGTGVDPVGDVTVTKINRGEGGVNYMQITSVDFDWDDSNGAVEYAVERTDGWTPSTWTVIGTSTSSGYHLIPTGNDLDEDYRFRVIAREEIGGNPNTDAGPSEEVFILFISDGGYTSGNSWTMVKEADPCGLYFTSWWGGGDEWKEGMIGIYGNGDLPNINMWAIAHTPQPIPDIGNQKRSFCDMYMFKGYNWDPPTLGLTIGTLTQPNPSGDTVCDYKVANDIFDPTFWAYNRPDVMGQNVEFCTSNQSAWAGLDNDEWAHVGYYLNDLLDPERNYVALGFANGDIPLSCGT